MSAPYPALPRQRDLLRFICGYRLRYGYAPSTDEMRDGLGLDSGSGIVRMLDGLEERGHIRRLRRRARAVEVLTDIPVPRDPDGEPLYFVRVP